MEEHILEALLKQALAGNLPNTAPPVLPASKKMFPKLLCLDFNKWVELAKFTRIPATVSDPWVGISYARLNEAVEKKKLVLAFAASNIIEAARPRDDVKRFRIAESIVGISNNIGLANHLVVAERELLQTVNYLCRGGTKPQSLRPGLVSGGLNATLLLHKPTMPEQDEELEPLIQLILNQTEVAANAISNLVAQDLYDDLKLREEFLVKNFNNLRQFWNGRTVEDRKTAELKSLFTSGEYSSVSQSEFDELYKWIDSPKRVEEFIDLTPHLDVLLTINGRRDSNLQRKIKPTDMRDFQFLQLVVPYANVVALERDAAQLVNVSGLARKYGTIVCSTFQDLAEVLSREGCV